MSIRFDAASCTVLALCSDCEWCELVSTAEIARRAALDHVYRVHPEQGTTTALVLHGWLRRNRLRRMHSA